MTAIEHLAEFRELLNRRDVSAHRMIACAQTALAKLNFGEVEQAQKILLGALTDYQVADEAITRFYQQYGSKKSAQGEKHGNPDNQSVAG